MSTANPLNTPCIKNKEQSINKNNQEEKKEDKDKDNHDDNGSNEEEEEEEETFTENDYKIARMVSRKRELKYFIQTLDENIFITDQNNIKYKRLILLRNAANKRINEYDTYLSKESIYTLNKAAFMSNTYASIYFDIDTITMKDINNF